MAELGPDALHDASSATKSGGRSPPRSSASCLATPSTWAAASAQEGRARAAVDERRIGSSPSATSVR
jgi:hypothetical protein